MTDYTKLTNFSVKDTLASGNPAKVIRGAEFDAEFNNIETAVNAKADEAELATEIQDRQAADQALQDSLNTEETARISADNTLQSNIDAEASARQSADNILQGNIDAEASARQSADTTLQGNIDAEEASRIAADTTLQGNIDLKADKDNPVFTGKLLVGTTDNAIDAALVVDSGTNSSIALGSGLDYNVIRSERQANNDHNLLFGVDYSGSVFQERMRLTSDGKLGIGTANPATKLDVAGDIKVSSLGNGSTAQSIQNATEPQFNLTTKIVDNTLNRPVFRIGLDYNDLENTGVNFHRGDSSIGGFLSFDTDTGQERMRLTSDGKLGIGTTNPFSKFHVTDSRDINMDGNGSGQLTFTGSSYSGAIALNEQGLNLYHNSSSRALIFGTNEQERMRLTSSGYLKADPSGSYNGGTQLSTTDHVFFNNLNNVVTLAVINSKTDVTGSVNIDSQFTPSGSQNLHYRALSNSSTVFSVAGDGTVSNVNGVIAAGSDIKLKENITDATPKLDDITALRFVNFDLKDNPDLGKQFGVIAQEIEEVFPNLVINTPDTEEVETTDEEGNTVTETVETGTVTKSVKYSVLTLMAVKALQELKAEKDELEAKHEQLISEVDILRQRIEAIEANN